MKKEIFIEKLIKCIYGIFGFFDEYKWYEVDCIGN